MSPYFETIRLYGLEQYKDRRREADQWRLCPPSTHPTWLARQGRQLLCRLGGRLIRAGQHLQTLYDSRDPLYTPSFTLHGSALRTDRSA
jgi:hypothetical protein